MPLNLTQRYNGQNTSILTLSKALQAQPSQDIAKTVAEAMAKINYHRKRATNNSLIRVESTGTILSADDRAHRYEDFKFVI